MLPELFHAHHSLHQEDIPFWLSLAEETNGPILELGCGTGRVLLPLVAAGQHGIGIDRSLAMLAFARNLFQQTLLVPQLVAADMRSFHFHVQFSLVLLPCNTFSTLDRDERLSCLECVRRHLQPGGRFAFSIPNPDTLLMLAEVSEAEIEEEYLLPSSGNPVQVSSAWQRIDRHFTLSWIYDVLLPNGKLERFTETVKHQLIPAADYLDEVRSVGFEVSHLYGDFDRSEYQTDSPYLIFICSI